MIRDLILKIYQNSLIRFLAVGGAGFLTNLVVFYLLKIEVNSTIAYLIAYFSAVFVTWLLNRLFTFHSHNPNRTKEWLRYALIYIITGSIQFIVFTLLIDDTHLFHQYQVAALIITAVSIALLNYGFSKRFAFLSTSH